MTDHVESHPLVLPTQRDAALHELVDVGPDLTSGTAELLRRRVTDLLSLHEVCVILDLRATERLDAVGLGALVAARRRLHAMQGCLHPVVGPLALHRLRSSGLSRFFDLAPDPDAAAEHRSLASEHRLPPAPRRPTRG